jgi:excisionase family DNA binding protein
MDMSGQSSVEAAEANPVVARGFATVPQASEFLGLSRSTIYQLMEAGELRYARFGRSRRLPWAAVYAYGEKYLVS